MLKTSQRQGAMADAVDEVDLIVSKISQYTAPLRIAFVGVPGVGKSDTQNTIGSYVCRPRQLKQLARAGKGQNNVTKQFTEHVLVSWHSDVQENRQSNVIMVDTSGQVVKELQALYATIKGDEGADRIINDAIRDCLVTPLADAGARCLVVVVNAEYVWKDYQINSTKWERSRGGPIDIPETSTHQVHAMLETLKKIQILAGECGMRTVCMVTHMDQVDQDVAKDMRKLKDSKRAKRILDYVAVQLGIKRNQIHAHVNILTAYNPADDMELGRVALKAFDQAMQFAQDAHNEMRDNPAKGQPEPGLQAMRCRMAPHAY
eukprot:jgi/Ulvmu1/11526/UM078_0015.1